MKTFKNISEEMKYINKRRFIKNVTKKTIRKYFEDINQFPSELLRTKTKWRDVLIQNKDILRELKTYDNFGEIIYQLVHGSAAENGEVFFNADILFEFEEDMYNYIRNRNTYETKEDKEEVIKEFQYRIHSEDRKTTYEIYGNIW